MRHAILVLAVALTAGTTQVYAELVTYNMTGTITSAGSYTGQFPSFAVSDHINWTLQYNTSTPMLTYSGTSNSGSLYTPLITNIVDRTTGSGFFVLPSLYVPPTLAEAGASAGASLSLSSGSSSFFGAGQYATGFPGSETIYNSGLQLTVNGSLPTLNLASLQLNNLPLNLATSSFGYSYAFDMMPGGQVSFMASVDSISAPMYGAPEPGALTLFLLGAAGLAGRAMRRRLRQVG